MAAPSKAAALRSVRIRRRAAPGLRLRRGLDGADRWSRRRTESASGRLVGPLRTGAQRAHRSRRTAAAVPSGRRRRTRPRGLVPSPQRVRRLWAPAGATAQHCAPKRARRPAQCRREAAEIGPGRGRAPRPHPPAGRARLPRRRPRSGWRRASSSSPRPAAGASRSAAPDWFSRRWPAAPPRPGIRRGRAPRRLVRPPP